jgi:hypothetical protein
MKAPVLSAELEGKPTVLETDVGQQMPSPLIPALITKALPVH